MWPWNKRPSIEAPDWNDADRDELLDTLGELVPAELRFRQKSPEEIVTALMEVHVEDAAPEAEWDAYRDYIVGELKRSAIELEGEMATWPEPTDCDRLDAAEASLLEAGVMLWQASPCCDTCTGAELPDRIDQLEEARPGLRDTLRGYAFFIDQSIAQMLSQSEDISLYVAYGWFPAEGTAEEADPDAYRREALTIGHEVVAHFERAGLATEWNGDLNKKIGMNVCWRRRTRLT